ncbi:hypothetical protein [Streptomyces sp. SID14515]|uniref:hypothetical protein n=1 Tax=Streptomyces sp. SID14515 TaxID=2706074 RepID=UPI0013C7966E|nr:hypothetical protein [Streptomyces sp. SID14515]NEB38992.1 hypothetical protein [Streptomyces sp. SID14515]
MADATVDLAGGVREQVYGLRLSVGGDRSGEAAMTRVEESFSVNPKSFAGAFGRPDATH